MWLSASNKDLFSFDFVRAATRWIREHRRCDDSRGTLTSTTSEGSLESKIEELQQKIVDHTNRVAALEADLEIAKRDLAKDQEALEALLAENDMEPENDI